MRDDKVRDRLNLRDAATLAWPVTACFSAMVSLQLFSVRADYIAALPMSLIVCVGTCAAMFSMIGAEGDVRPSQRDLRIGTLGYVVVWSVWLEGGSTWKEYSLHVDPWGDIVTTANGIVGFICLRMFVLEFQRNTRICQLVVAASVVTFVLPIHTSQTLTRVELTYRLAIFSALYFCELFVNIIYANNVRLRDNFHWNLRFQLCSTVWVLTVSDGASVVSVAALLSELYWISVWRRKSAAGSDAGTVVPTKSQPSPSPASPAASAASSAASSTKDMFAAYKASGALSRSAAPQRPPRRAELQLDLTPTLETVTTAPSAAVPPPTQPHHAFEIDDDLV